MIDRGFVSCNAHYFSLQTDNKIDQDSNTSNKYITQEIIKGDDLWNKSSFTLASQIEKTRIVYYQGAVALPPIQSGRFLSSSECLHSDKLAVIGQEYLELTWEDSVSGKRMISLKQGDYEVIGVMGTKTKSTVNNLIYIGMGSVEKTEIESGIFYLDSETENMNTQTVVNKLFGGTKYKIEDIHMPMPTTNAVEGQILMKDEMNATVAIFIVITYICNVAYILNFSKKRLTVCLLVGHSYWQSVWNVSKPIIFSGIIGLLTGIVFTVLLSKAELFQIPSSYIFTSLSPICIIGLIALFMLPVFEYMAVRKINISEHMR
jgi:hypothetical protein